MQRKLNIASWILIGMLLLPMVQQVTGWVHVRKLKGSFVTAEYPGLKAKSWFSGEYQDSTEKALNDRFGFRNLFVRVNNQVAFSLYRKALANGVVIGKDNYLYETNYIYATQGADYLGDSVIEKHARNLKEIQTYLEEQGKSLLIAFAAGKGSYYPEYIPDRYDVEDRETNIEAYSRQFEELGVNYIDFNRWFVDMKDTSDYRLYPRTGIHWSYYGMVLAMDSLSHALEGLTGKDLAEIEWDRVKETRNYRSSDRDVEEGMNILFRISWDKLGYPEFTYNDTNTDTLKGVVIADSFYWGLHNLGFSHRILHEGEFWYYFKRIYGNHLESDIEIETIDPLERLNDVDVVILMATEATMKKFPFGFGELLHRDSY